MTDPRDIAHDKKVKQEKKRKGEDIAHGTTQTPPLGKKPRLQEHESDGPVDHEPATEDQNPSDKARSAF